MRRIDGWLRIGQLDGRVDPARSMAMWVEREVDCKRNEVVGTRSVDARPAGQIFPDQAMLLLREHHQQACRGGCKVNAQSLAFLMDAAPSASWPQLTGTEM